MAGKIDFPSHLLISELHTLADCTDVGKFKNDPIVIKAHVAERVSEIVRAVFQRARPHTGWDKALQHPSLAFFSALLMVLENPEDPLDEIMGVAMGLLQDERVTTPYMKATNICDRNEDVVKAAFDRKGIIDNCEYVMDKKIVAHTLCYTIIRIGFYNGSDPIAKVARFAAEHLEKIKGCKEISKEEGKKGIKMTSEIIAVDAPSKTESPNGWMRVEVSEGL